MSFVLIVLVSDSVSFPALSAAFVCTSYSVSCNRLVNVLFDCHAPHSSSPTFLILYCFVISFIPLSLSFWLHVTSILFVVLVKLGASVPGEVLSILLISILCSSPVCPSSSSTLAIISVFSSTVIGPS